MRAKKTIIGLLLVCGIVAVFGAKAFADDFTCTITRVGGYTSESGSITVNLTDVKGTFNGRGFKIPINSRSNQILAVLLTAASNGSTVFVKVDLDTNTLKAAYYNVD
jgi:hypothetical protein